MGSLFASPKKTVPEFTGLQVQTAVQAIPIALIYGCPRIPVNIIYANGFSRHKAPSGGKGLLSGGKGSTQFIYRATLALALGEGPIEEILLIYQNQAIYSRFNFPANGGSFYYTGAGFDPPDSFIAANWPDDARSYKDTAYIVLPDFNLDSTATVPQFNLLATGLFQGTCPLNLNPLPSNLSPIFADADPATCIYDFLTHDRRGAGFPPQFIDTTALFSDTNPASPTYCFDPTRGDGSVQTYCQAVGFGFSFILDNAEPANSVLGRWLKLLSIAAVWTGATLKLIPYYDGPSGGNPGWDASSGIGLKYYQPQNIAPLFDLTDDDFVQSETPGDDPVTFSRTDITDVYNIVRLDFKDRNNLFNDNVVEARDEAAVEAVGPRVDNVGLANEFTLYSYASMAAQLIVQRNVAVRRKYQFKLSWEYSILDPMDVVTLTRPSQGLNKFPVRILSLDEDDKHILSVEAEEFPLGSASATLYQRNLTPPTLFITNPTPDPVNPPIIFEPTTPFLIAEAEANPTVIIGISGGLNGIADPNWGGANVYLSLDNVNYRLETTQTGPSDQGILTAPLPGFSGTNPDNSDTLQVSFLESGGVPSSVTSAQAANGQSICAIVDQAGNFELLTYTTATIVSGHTYNLTGLYRGFYGTIALAHGIGSKFLLITDTFTQIQLPPQYVGQMFYVKLQSFNIFNSDIQDLSSCIPYFFTPRGVGFGIQFYGGGGALVANALVTGQETATLSGAGLLKVSANLNLRLSAFFSGGGTIH